MAYLVLVRRRQGVYWEHIYLIILNDKHQTAKGCNTRIIQKWSGFLDHHFAVLTPH